MESSVMQQFFSTWYLSTGAIVYFSVLGLYGASKLRHVMWKTGSVIRSRADLDLVRDAINLNMLYAIALMLGFLALALAAAWLLWIGALTAPSFLLHSVPFSAFAALLAYFTRKVEAQFRAMIVDSPDPEVESTFRRWLGQWGQPRLQLD